MTPTLSLFPAPTVTVAQDGKKWGAGLFTAAFFFLFIAFTSVFSFLINPVGWNFNLILGTLLYHAAWFCWRGPPQQLCRLASSERMPHTMLTGVSLLAATYMWKDNKKESSACTTRSPLVVHSRGNPYPPVL